MIPATNEIIAFASAPAGWRVLVVDPGIGIWFDDPSTAKKTWFTLAGWLTMRETDPPHKRYVSAAIINYGRANPAEDVFGTKTLVFPLGPADPEPDEDEIRAALLRRRSTNDA